MVGIKRTILSILLGLLLFITSCSKTTSQIDPNAIFANNYDGKLVIHFFDMEADKKTGESILIQTPKGKTMMIDAGTPAAGPIVNDYLEQLNIEKIDLVLLSHAHMDHVGGFNTILKTKEIGKVIEPNVPVDEDAYYKYKELIEEKGIPVEYAEENDTIELEEGLVLEFLNPPKGTSPETLPWGYKSSSHGFINDLSVVIKMTYKENTFLFTGDIYEKREEELIENYGEKLDVNVVVAPHHGDITSSSESFIKTVNPDITLIPSNILFSKIVYDRYTENDSEVYFSGEDGNVMLVSDGEKIKVYTEK